MASKLVAVRIKQPNNASQPYSDEIPIGARAENVAYDNTKNLLTVLGTIDMDKGDVQTQLDALLQSYFNIEKDIMGAIDDWIGENIETWTQTYGAPLDSTLSKSNMAPQSSAVPTVIAINGQEESAGTKLRIRTSNLDDFEVLTPSDVDDTLTQEGEPADAKATGEMIMINNAATEGTKIRLTTTNEDISLVTTNGQPFIMRKINAQVRDPNTDEMIPAGILSSDSQTTIKSYENAAISRINNTKTAAINEITQLFPSTPTINGAYSLQCIVNNGVITYQWTLIT